MFNLQGAYPICITNHKIKGLSIQTEKMVGDWGLRYVPFSMLKKSWKHNASLWFFLDSGSKVRLLAVLGYNQTSGVHWMRNIENTLLQYHHQKHPVGGKTAPAF